MTFLHTASFAGRAREETLEVLSYRGGSGGSSNADSRPNKM